MKVKDLIEKLQELNRPESELEFVGYLPAPVDIKHDVHLAFILDGGVDAYGPAGQGDPGPGVPDDKVKVTIWGDFREIEK